MKTFDFTGDVIDTMEEAARYFASLDRIEDPDARALSIDRALTSFAFAYVKSLRPDLRMTMGYSTSEKGDWIELDFGFRYFADDHEFETADAKNEQVTWLLEFKSRFNAAAFSFRDAADDALSNLAAELRVACRRIPVRDDKQAA